MWRALRSGAIVCRCARRAMGEGVMSIFRRLLVLALVAALAAPTVFAQENNKPAAPAAAAKQAEPRHEDVMVKMRDGIELATTIYYPDGDGPWPVVVSRTPYNKAPMGKGAGKYTKAGYAYVVQDVRGKFASK